MKMTVTRWLLASLATLGFVGSTPAQPEPNARKYVEFPIDPNFEKGLRERLVMEKDRAHWEELIKKIVADPSKLPVTKDDLKKLKLDDPDNQKKFKDWVASDPALKKAIQDLVKQKQGDLQPPEVKKLQDDFKKILEDVKKGKVEPPDFNKGIGPGFKPPEPPRPKEDGFVRTTEKVMKQAENSRLGDWLRDSPAWKRAFKDLKTSINSEDMSQWKVGEWQKKLHLPEGKIGELGEGALERIRNLPRPHFEGVRPNLPAIGNLGVPKIGAPQVPDFSTPTLPTISSGFLWLLLIALFLLAAWMLLRWSRRAARARAGAGAQLGPWPVRPEAVSTRGELVVAFDYLALLTLGFGVQSWNHHAITRSWAEKAPDCAATARRLALLYELARYTEGADALTPPQRDQARQALVQLSEAL
jgi:hypothetical protein